MHSITRSLSRAFTRSAYWSNVQLTTVAARFYPAFYRCPRQEQRYRNLVQRYRRKLRASYNKFSTIPDNTVVQGRFHSYIEDGGIIYRCLRGPGESKPEKVLSVEWLKGGEGEEEEEEEEGERSLQRVRLSPGESLLAATVKAPHQEEARCIVVRLTDMKTPHHPLLILDNVFSFEWASDNTLFYSRQEGLKCRSVYRLDLTEAGARNTLVYEEHDPEFFVEVGRSGDGQLLTLNSTSKSSSEVRVICSSAPDHAPALVQPRQPGLVYYTEHSRGELYILANTGPNQEFQLLKAPLSSPSMRSWLPVYTPSAGWAVKDMELLQDHCVFTLRHPSGRLHLQTVPLKDPTRVSSLELPLWACGLESQRASQTDTQSFRFLLFSPVCPPSAYLYTPSPLQILTEQGPPPERPHHSCQTTRLEAPSKDGTMVPITLLHRPPLADLGSAPMLVHVYGAYGMDLNMAFSPDKRLLLDRGWALAYCHVRGGGERGLGWHRAGRLERKQRGVEDLAACLQRLHDLGVSTPDRTALTARSAGAVLVGALCNQQPQLLRAITVQAPFLDVLGTMQDPSLPLTVEERGEWGDPLTSPQHRDNIASYCPCCNITPQHYPSMLITAYQGDSRVPVSGVEKYVARLRTAVDTHSSLGMLKPETRVILDLQPGRDHFGPEDFELSLCESARQMAFLHMELGLDKTADHKKRRG
ncbi:prolyl endopeptidase-like isoform X2 [Clupea harengus]|uniref:Prolyl endopeptidase n=1 Tax=Clupea harengus TaxID=7950 RepID=A0A6P8GD91_CLUHA|nr:prolyl endopeptidase-like isoform X2 [Clupea harengus]